MMCLLALLWLFARSLHDKEVSRLNQQLRDLCQQHDSASQKAQELSVQLRIVEDTCGATKRELAEATDNIRHGMCTPVGSGPPFPAVTHSQGQQSPGLWLVKCSVRLYSCELHTFLWMSLSN